MKALIISNLTKRFQPGHFTMIESLQELGYEVHWAANFSDYKEDISKVPIEIHNIDFIRNPFHPGNFKAYIQLMRLLKKQKYDVIHCNSPIGGVLGRICGRQAKVPKIIYTAHGFHFYEGAPLINRSLYKWVEMYLSRKTDILITITKEDYNSALHFKKLNKNLEVFYVPGVGINRNEIINTGANRKELCENLGVEEDVFFIISAGELNKNKNQKIIIETISNIEDNKKIHYILCGLGPLEEELKELAKEKKVDNQVHFLGFRNDVIKLMKSCDLFVMPSYREGLSRAIMEAMVCGLPVIASKIRGNVDLIEEGKNGYLFNPKDNIKLKESILNLVNNHNEREKISKNNIKDSIKYDFNNIKYDIKMIYSGVLINEL